MNLRLFPILFLLLSVGACTVSPSIPDTVSPTYAPLQPGDPTLTPVYLAPGSIPVTDDSGTLIATQPGPQWVLLSGVDEHGLMAEPRVHLLDSPKPDAAQTVEFPTGVPAAIAEIRHTGPQNLQRFYHVELLDGQTGWISDYYVRRVSYLYTQDAQEIELFFSPGGIAVTRLPNVSPVTLVDPTRSDWWLVRASDNSVAGWVSAGEVKESSEPAFLLKLTPHTHTTPTP